MRISYGITVHNEQKELERLLNKLLIGIDEQDERSKKTIIRNL